MGYAAHTENKHVTMGNQNSRKLVKEYRDKKDQKRLLNLLFFPPGTLCPGLSNNLNIYMLDQNKSIMQNTYTFYAYLRKNRKFRKSGGFRVANLTKLPAPMKHKFYQHNFT